MRFWAPSKTRRGLGRPSVCLAVLALLLCLMTPRAGADGAFALADVQAALVEKIVSFVRWPGFAFENGAQPFVVTVLGRSEVEPRLVHLLGRRPPLGRRAVVRRIEQIDQLGLTHVLFISSTSEDELRRILARLDGLPVLTVSSAPGFGRRGVAVNLYEEGGRVRFEINQQALKRAQLQASYQLLAVARLVETR